jgi:hypothetical protein
MFPMRHAVAERKIRQRCPVSREIVPADVRCDCLKCGGIARKGWAGGTATNPIRACRCIECSFAWEVEDGAVRYYESEKEKNRLHLHGGWWDIEKGLLPIFWEKELTDG